MPLNYSLYPTKFKQVLKLLDRDDIQFNSKLFADKISLQFDLRQLCYWLENHQIAQPSWFDAVIKMVRKLKIPVLLPLQKAFRSISKSQNLLRKFERNGKKLMDTIRDILGQIGQLIHLGNFYLWDVRNVQRMIKNQIDPYDDRKVETNLRLKPSEYRIYRLIEWMSVWNFKTAKEKHKRTNKRIQNLKNQISSINHETKLVVTKYWHKMNEFERQLFKRNKAIFQQNTASFIKMSKQRPSEPFRYKDHFNDEKADKYSQEQSVSTFQDHQESPKSDSASQNLFSSDDEMEADQPGIHQKDSTMESTSKKDKKENKKKLETH